MYKKLFGQTAIYGLSSVLVKVFPFFLTPILAKIFGPLAMSPFVNFYSMAGIISVLLTHGMETTFFKFSQEESNKNKVLSTVVISVFSASILFMIFGYLFKNQLAIAFKTPTQINFLTWFLFILGFDAMCSILFAKLRLEEKTKKYALIKIINSVLQFVLVVFFVIWLPKLIEGEPSALTTFFTIIYNPSYGVGYTFLANLLASILTFILLISELKNINFEFDWIFWKKMMSYALPITVAGLAGITNETLDRQFLKYLLPTEQAEFQMGIYGTVYKIATFIALFKMAYLLGIEPFFFSHAKNENSAKTYSQLMNVFTIVNVLILMFLLCNLTWIGKLYIPNPKYYEGFDVVPMILIGTVFLGIYLNLSIWYKLTGKTTYGAYISLIGAGLTIFFNVVFIPLFGYAACAFSTMLVYFIMMIISYYWGKKYYPIPYKKRKFIIYMSLAIGLGSFNYYVLNSNFWTGNLFFLATLGFIFSVEKEQILKIIRAKR